MRVYVAGSCKNRFLVRQLMDEIEKWGYTISLDWTKRTPSENPRENALEDIGALSLCDAFIFCADIKSRGKYFELGYATALKKPIAVYMANLTSITYIPMEKSGIIKHYIDNESVFIKGGFYPIMTELNELKSWLDNIREINSLLDKASD